MKWYKNTSQLKMMHSYVQNIVQSLSRIFFCHLFLSKYSTSENQRILSIGGDETEAHSASISPALINGKKLNSGLGALKNYPQYENYVSDLSSSRHGSLYTSSAGGPTSNSNLASSFNSGLNTVGLNNGKNKSVQKLQDEVLKSSALMTWWACSMMRVLSEHNLMFPSVLYAL